MGVYHTLAGVLYMVGWMVFLDGAILSKNSNRPYVFVDTLSGIFCTVGLMLFAICNIRAITGGQSDDDSWGMMGGGGGGGDQEEDAPLKARIMFFIAASFMLAGMTVGVWQLAGPRKDYPWSGWALLLQVLIHMISALMLGIGQVKSSSTEDPAF